MNSKGFSTAKVCARDIVSAAPAPWQPHIWRSELKDAISSVAELGHALGLSLKVPDNGANDGFRLRVPRPFVARMRHGDPNDPLLRQVLPTATENEPVSVLPDGTRFSVDPLREQDFARAPAMIQKYRGRVLLIATPACAVHCRYCFRRHFPYEDHGPDRREAALAALREDAEVKEVILSGGDPLVLTDAALGELIRRIDGIGHVQRLRIHTRLPIVLPSRVTRGLLDILVSTRLRGDRGGAREPSARTRRGYGAGVRLSGGGSRRDAAQPERPPSRRQRRRAHTLRVVGATLRARCASVLLAHARCRSGDARLPRYPNAGAAHSRCHEREVAGLPAAEAGARGARQDREDSARLSRWCESRPGGSLEHQPEEVRQADAVLIAVVQPGEDGAGESEGEAERKDRERPDQHLVAEQRLQESQQAHRISLERARYDNW